MLGLTILGSNSAIPAFNRHPTAQILTLQDQLFLIDCGEGTQMQMNKYRIRKSRISKIFISHLHGDHYFGLIGLLTSMNLLGRKDPLHIYGPPDLEIIIKTQMEKEHTLFDIHFCALQNSSIEKIVDDTSIEVCAFSTKHSVPCWGFLFKEKKINRRIDTTQGSLQDIPLRFYKRLQEGEDYIKEDGTIITNDSVTVEGPKPLSYAFCADTLYDETLLNHIMNIDLLYHETTYLDNLKQKATERFHSTTKQAATLAQKANVKRLLIGHFSSQYEALLPFLEEATSIFSHTDLALEGLTYRLHQ